MNFYRYDEYLVNWDYNTNRANVRLYLTTYKLIRKTPCGYWIKEIKKHAPFLLKPNEELIISKTSPLKPNERWVSSTSKKRIAYPTKKEAIESYIARKERQLSILKYQIGRAQEGLIAAEELL